MASIGSSLAALIALIDKFVRLNKRVQGAPQEVEDILDDISHHGSALDSLQGVLDEYMQTFSMKRDALDNAIRKFRDTLAELERFIAKYTPLTNADAGKFETAQHMVDWVIDDEYNQTVKKLKDDIAKHGERIKELLQPLKIHSDTVTYKAVVERVKSADGDIKWRIPFQGQARILSRRTSEQQSTFILMNASSKSIAPSISSIGTSQSSPSARQSISCTTIADTIKSTPATRRVNRTSFVPKGGIARIWCKRGRASKVISKIRFQEHKDGRLLWLQVVDADGEEIIHRMPENPIPYLEHHHKTHNIRKLDCSITNLVKFFDDGNYEYSFGDEVDCRAFQEKVMGKELVSCAEVNSIYSKRSKTGECNWQTLRIWKDWDSGAGTIMFYGAAKDKEFLQFDTTHLCPSISKDVLKLKFDGRVMGKKRTKEEELEKKLDCLKITFTDPGGQCSHILLLPPIQQ
ncbi:MAG: hypothetical protein M1813_002147 [Trichoglossum hirsutum]|nr:MAG: hypothetical protein M1813_002147 [Trichoglossum hirsutum]